MMQFATSADADIRKLMPSRNGLLQHTKRAIYQAAFLWREAVIDHYLPEPMQWGWSTDITGHYIPTWQENVFSQKALDELIAVCSCKLARCKNCRCAKANVSCLLLCGCKNKCTTAIENTS